MRTTIRGDRTLAAGQRRAALLSALALSAILGLSAAAWAQETNTSTTPPPANPDVAGPFTPTDTSSNGSGQNGSAQNASGQNPSDQSGHGGNTPGPLVPPEYVGHDVSAAGEFRGRKVEAVKVVGNTKVATAVILNLVKTHEGNPFDPDTVVGDYQRIYDRLKSFANVEARVEPTATGVIVIFAVTEQSEIADIRFHGNTHVNSKDIRDVVDIKKGQAIDRFRINVAREAIEQLYRDKNYPFVHVTIDDNDLAKRGIVTFDVVEGPKVRIRKIHFVGNDTFSSWKLLTQIKSATWIFIFRPGKYDPDQVDEDVASLRQFYQDKGFFDARVGRKLVFSPNQSEMQLNFVINEGIRYKIDHVIFEGNSIASEAKLRQNLNLTEGQYYDDDVLQRDTRQMVKTYSPYGLIYDQQPGVNPNPDYLRIESKPVFLAEKGHINLVYEINEGKSFDFGRFLIKGNDRTKDNVILRELHMVPGQKYNSAEIQDAQDRLRGTPYFSGVTITPIGDDPDVRDVLVEVTEQHTASVQAGVGINSNGGLGGNLSYEQKNFDIANPPDSFSDFFSDRAWTGAGQDFRASFDPGTEVTDATLSFTEPYLLDQPYSLTTTGYLRQYLRENYTDRRLGGRVSIGKRFDYIYSAAIAFRGEDVKVFDINTPADRPVEIDDALGHHTLTSIAAQFRRDTSNHGPIAYKGDNAVVGVEQYGAMGGTVDFTRLTLTVDNYTTLNEDLVDRRVVLNMHGDVGYDLQHAPVYESFYGGGIGSIRGFEYRGVSPRGRNAIGQPENDPIGGDFAFTGGPELGFPIAADMLRGVLFIDVGDVEPNFHFGDIRSSAGFGFRLVLPFFGQLPLALDFGFPITHSHTDNEQVISFSLGLNR